MFKQEKGVHKYELDNFKKFASLYPQIYEFILYKRFTQNGKAQFTLGTMQEDMSSLIHFSLKIFRPEDFQEGKKLS